jgi:excinuclease ABC subunit A
MRRRLGPRWLALTGAREHNLKGADVRIPLGALTVVTGVSGSGKSTLVHDVLYRALEEKLHGANSAKQHLGERVGAYDALTGWEAVDDVVLVDQSPIGRTPRSNAVTYVKAWDEVRRLFAEQPLAASAATRPAPSASTARAGAARRARARATSRSRWCSWPTCSCRATVRRPALQGRGARGRGARPDRARRAQMTVDEAIRFFPREEKLGQALWQLQQVGLGYLRLGQPATTLSGGEAQRVKIARELARRPRGAARSCT